jgi:ubiquinone/menaquinone biosynthesis C-methylase UbiE/pimeloyl-ACP methyl ester carboxylesterase
MMGGQLLNRSTPIAEASLRGLHPRSIEDAGEILRLLERTRENCSVFHRGLNTQVDLETALLEQVGNGYLIFDAPNFEKSSRRQVFLNFNLDGRSYFFASFRAAPVEGGRLTLQIPKTIFYSERRDRMRRVPDWRAGDPRRVQLEIERGETAECFVTDISPGGLGLLVQRESVVNSNALLTLEFLDGAEAGVQTRAQLRNYRSAAERPGWMRIGAARTNDEMVEPINVEYWTDIADGKSGVGEADPVENSLDSAAPRVLRFPNSKGEEIVGLVDSWGDPRGATAVVIPNGWGQTKEALLPLARTIVATFRASGEPICVVRFDGIRKRGESYNDPACRMPGREYLHYVFSQGAEDIGEVSRFLRKSPVFRASSIVLVSFSAASIEARKALVQDRDGLISAWISVVGSPDVQSMTRAISGGVDFAVGCERRTQFGVQELLSVSVNIDRIVSDGQENDLLFIEHSRSDMATIDVPITWYHGKFDAWVDFSRVRDMLSHGNTANRRLVVLPTGHQLKSSQQADKVFQCIASEIGRIGPGIRALPQSAHSHEIHLLRRAERTRMPSRTEDLQNFWRDYLIGRDESYGIELLANSEAYRDLMELQVDSLLLDDDQDILDLGSGVGTLEIQLALMPNCPNSLSITSIDYVREAFHRAKGRLAKIQVPKRFRVFYVESDLDLLHDEQIIPIRSNSFDAVIASLLLSYLENPSLVLAEIYRIMRPGGRLVISSLCRDADISTLYVESVAELRLKVDADGLPGLDRSKLATAARNFLNDAAKILELEEAGAFHFWEQADLENLVIDAGFSEVTNRSSLGSPPQAFVVSARKR